MSDTLLAGLLGAVPGFIAVWLSIVTYRRERRLHRRLEEREKLADVTATVTTDADESSPVGATNHFLVVVNRGPAQARDISAELEPHPKEASKSLPRTADGALARELLDPGQSFRVALVLRFNGAYAFYVRLSWSDDQGSKQKRLPLTILG